MNPVGVRRIGGAVALVAGLVVFAPPAPAGADHGDDEVFFDPEAEVDGPQNLTEGPDGNLWFTSTLNDRIGRLDPDAEDPAASIVTFEAQVDAPWDITAGPDGNLWFTGDAAVGRITPAGVVTTFPDAGIDGGHEITAFGNDLWFTSTDNDRVGTVTTAGAVTMYSDPGLAGPTGITVGRYVQLTIVGGTPRNPVFHVDPIPTIWFANTDADQVGFIGPGGTTFHYLTPTGLEAPTDITFDPSAPEDGAVWFSGRDTDNQGQCRAGSFSSTNCAVHDAGVTDIGPIAVDQDVDRPWHPWRTDLATDSFLTRTADGQGDETFTPEDADGITDLLVREDSDLWFTSGANDGIGWVDIDGEPPILAIEGLEDGDQFPRDELPIVDYTCSDPIGGSGIDECDAYLGGSVPSGQQLPDTGIGERRLLVFARDAWGNSAQAPLDFTTLATSSCDGRPATAELAFGDEPMSGGTEPYVVVGTPGDDDVHLTGNQVVVCLGAGDDRVEGGIHLDSRLGTGHDVLSENAVGRVDLGPGNDRASTLWGPLEVLGGDGADILRGGAEVDRLDGGRGDDQVLGAGGNDTLRGREGRDRLDGGDGGDRLLGGGADDLLFGRAEADVLDGGTGNDVLNGGAARDLCAGGPGALDRQFGCELKSGFP